MISTSIMNAMEEVKKIRIYVLSCVLLKDTFPRSIWSTFKTEDQFKMHTTVWSRRELFGLNSNDLSVTQTVVCRLSEIT